MTDCFYVGKIRHLNAAEIMFSTTHQSVFSIPLKHQWALVPAGGSEMSECQVNRLNRFVGDDANHLLRILAEDRFEEFFSVKGQLFCWPLVFFGPSGTGKTSLALALISALSEHFSNIPVSGPVQQKHPADLPKSQPVPPVILSAADFDRRFRAAISTDRVSDFRSKMIQSRGLLLDNLQQLQDKWTTQRELLIVMDQMLSENYPVIITVDQDPLKGNLLIPQLASRLSGGLCLPVQQPGEAARSVIIRDLCDLHQMNMTDEAIDLLVKRLKVSVPRIQNFFARLKSSRPLSGSSSVNSPAEVIDEKYIQSAFELSEENRQRLSSLVIKTVASELKVRPGDLVGNSRKQSIVFGRNIAIYLIRQLIGSSFTKIGSLLGNRDHTTILHSYRKICSLMEQADPAVGHRTLVEKLQQQLTNLFSLETTLID